MRVVDPCVGINEENMFSLRDACAGIPGSRDLTSMDRDDPGASSPGDFWRRIRRCIINYDDLERLCGAGRRRANRSECRGKLELFVVGRDDK
jgi:hypothetical protein